jgi:hypothetical protein
MRATGEATGEAPCGRFWALAQTSDEDDDLGGVPASPCASAARYTSSPEDQSLKIMSSASVRRRQEKKRRQREAALILRDHKK